MSDDESLADHRRASPTLESTLRHGGDMEVVSSSQRTVFCDMQRHTGTNHGTAGDQHRRNRLFWGVPIVLLGLQGVFLAAYVSLAVKSVGDNTQQIVVEAARWNLACWAIGKNCHYRNDSALSWPSGGKDEPVTNLTQVAKALQDQAESSDTLIGHIQDVAGVASITRVRNQAYDLMTLAAGIGAGTEIPNHENVSQQLRGIGLDVESLSSNLGQMNAMTYDALRSFSRDYTHVLEQLETLLNNPSRAGWSSFTLRTKSFILDFLWDIEGLHDLTFTCADLAGRISTGQFEMEHGMRIISRQMETQIAGLSHWDRVWHRYASYEGKWHQEDSKLISHGWQRIGQMRHEMIVIRNTLNVVKGSTTNLLRKIEQRWSSEMKEVKDGQALVSHLAGFKAIVNSLHQRVNTSEGWISA